MFPKLDSLLHSELRLAVMSILSEVESADFTYIKKQTGSTSGNLSVQLDKLSAAEYITVEKGFKGKMPCTTCRITDKGIEAFRQYVEALRSYLSPSDPSLRSE
jgi:DNA-binding MarR family transcriptional regulator